jgi:poly(3-hydroxybutyrate) depolymerase
VSTHGWGGSGFGEEKKTLLVQVSENRGAIVVFPDGFSDSPNEGAWGSWNVAGSTQSPGPKGDICYDGEVGNCYNSCKEKGLCDPEGCSWTTCLNDVTETGVGTSGVDGFIPSLYDLMEEQFCIDTTREYHTGMSNGGIATYQMGASMSSRLAAIAPLAGSMHTGFLQAPTRCLPLIDLHGEKDMIVPANTTLGNGWYFELNHDIMKAYAAQCPQCSTRDEDIRRHVTSFDGRRGLYCVEYGCKEVARCSWFGAHAWPPFTGPYVWEFVSQFDNKEHLGFGRVSSDLNFTRSPSRLEQVSTLPVNTDISTGDFFFDGIKKTTSADSLAKDAHYGNPANGCKSDEDVLHVLDGVVCAPRVAVDPSTYQPKCSLDEIKFDPNNGCPTDTPPTTFGDVGAYPTCNHGVWTAGAPSAAHCMLTCGPCGSDDEDCPVQAHASCPHGATCKLGLHRHMSLGTCVYEERA